MSQHKTIIDELQVKILNNLNAKVAAESIVTYLEELELSNFDLVYAKWVLDRINEIGEGFTFVGSFDTLTELEEVPAEDIHEGGYAFVGTGVNFSAYFWDQSASTWVEINSDVNNE